MDGGTTPKTKRIRLDRALVARGLAADTDRARRLIMAGDVRVDGVRCDIAGTLVGDQTRVEVREARPYVSRGGLKLAHALEQAGISVAGLTAMDIGASTGGFSDVLLQRGVARLFAIDVGYGDLAWKIRTDPRVTVLERTNIRHVQALPDGVRADLAVIDASFISLELVLPAALPLLTPDAQVIALVKPQFEAAREHVGAGGVVRDHDVHRQVLREATATAQHLGLVVAGLYTSPLTGPAGNVEFLLWLRRDAGSAPAPDVEQMISAALAHAVILHAKAAPQSPAEDGAV